ncbi:glycosyltransferase family 4 protein [Geobacillus stearothermophilus]|uniref:glycosyltransferase family 4 protein n=1 Tax=Geobacillus stearothermophilus TaxID=1422 RepID=UPI002E23F353|nr:glycosyltransferase family 4 protein [Geobacillus stearothermophilus]MED4830815.1 glycosyltransferase family 4 protein [Geobacillus stearothermophilus]MED4959975.1 glycosyltransferase family 4 protein [Geobacillus stearothermophilus]
MKILQITHRSPFPPMDGGKIGIFSFTKYFNQYGHEVYLFSICSDKERDLNYGDLDFNNIKFYPFYKNIANKVLFLLLNSLLNRSLPYNMEKYIYKDVWFTIFNFLKENKVDIVHVDHLHMAYYGRKIKENFPDLPVVLREHNVEHTILQRVAENEKNYLKKLIFMIQANRLRKYEINIINAFDKILAITNNDYNRLLPYVHPDKLAIVPAGVNLDEFSFQNIDHSMPTKKLVSISSMDWLPNQDGLVWFIEKVMPILLNQIPNLELIIAGKGTPEWFYKFQNDHIKVLGFVEDVSELIRNSHVAIVPLFAGGGMRVKILNYMAWGIPVVSTSIGAEGINLENGREIRIADSPQEFADNIVELLSDYTIWSSQRELAFQKVRKLYSWEAIVTNTLKIYNDLIKKYDK